ncbi:MAG: tRNA (adenosine(37)-N6)-dimethylallyltransferase MiaA [Kiritimatiellae bacterium]|nr:tRNA (adenosine(37)-N6)-dimethylallyltransferase MiaA [Kiritimatiellia bacterium]
MPASHQPRFQTQENPEAFFLVGPTAIGKTNVAQCIAESNGYYLLSADAMLVYKCMDIGTAKPPESYRSEVTYWGVDVVEPDQSFNVGDYLRYVLEERQRLFYSGQRVVIVGGTGLYVKCLAQGLDPLPRSNEGLRNSYQNVLEKKGVVGIQQALRAISPERLKAIEDPQNPRRLIRALELADQDVVSAEKKWDVTSTGTLMGLRMPSRWLYPVIEERIISMYKQGLLDEVKALKNRYRELSETAVQAIGYKEALLVLANKCSLDEAKQQTIRRTKQLAKRQMTWFRNQMNVHWIEISPDMPVEIIAQEVMKGWEIYGPSSVVI